MKNTLLKLLLPVPLAIGITATAPSANENENETSIFDATALAHTCLNCHSSATHSSKNSEQFSIPNILSQDATAIYQQLLLYQQETLPPITTIMNKLVDAFDEQELKAIAEAVAKINLEQSL